MPRPASSAARDALLLCALVLAAPVAAGQEAGNATGAPAPEEPAPVRYHVDGENLTFLSWWYGVKARQAFGWWVENGGGRVPDGLRFERVDDPAEADVRLWFRDGSRVGPWCAEREEALGCARRAADGTWGIEIRTRDVDGGLYAYALVGDVAKHEIGHALGLPHSEDPRDVMHRALDTTSYAGARPMTNPLRDLAAALGLVVLCVVLVLMLLRVMARPDAPGEEDEPRLPPPR